MKVLLPALRGDEEINLSSILVSLDSILKNDLFVESGSPVFEEFHQFILAIPQRVVNTLVFNPFSPSGPIEEKSIEYSDIIAESFLKTKFRDRVALKMALAWYFALRNVPGRLWGILLCDLENLLAFSGKGRRRFARRVKRAFHEACRRIWMI